jgi:hypothetical protein
MSQFLLMVISKYHKHRVFFDTATVMNVRAFRTAGWKHSTARRRHAHNDASLLVCGRNATISFIVVSTVEKTNLKKRMYDVIFLK